MIFALTLLAAWYLSTWTRVVGSFLTRDHFSLPPEPRRDDLPPVSIIKPVKGLTAGLLLRLQASVNFSYPKYELILCCDNGDDAQTLLKNFSFSWRSYKKLALMHEGCVNVRLIIVNSHNYKNPKSQLLRAGYAGAVYEHILVSDENVILKEFYLNALVNDYMKNPVGLISQAVIYKDPPGWGGKLESAYLNGLYAPGLVLCSRLKIPAVMGKALFFEKKTFENAANFDQLEATIAEDYEFGRLVKKAGFTIAISNQPLQCSTSSKIPLLTAWHRLLRWGILRKYHEPVAFFLEPFSCSWFSSLAGSWAMARFSHHPVLFFFASLAIWFVSEVKICPHTTVVGWIIRELTAIPLWLTALFCRHVNWRGNKFKIGFRGKIKPKKGGFK